MRSRNKTLFEWITNYLIWNLKFKFRAFRRIGQSDHSDLIWLEQLAPEK